MKRQGCREFKRRVRVGLLTLSLTVAGLLGSGGRLDSPGSAEKEASKEVHARLAREIVAGEVKIHPASPLKGLKTYSDLAIVVDENIIAKRLPAAAKLTGSALKGGEHFGLSGGEAVAVFHYSYKRPAESQSTKPVRRELWCSVSKNQGKTWAEPRFVLADASVDGELLLSHVTLQGGLRLVLTRKGLPAELTCQEYQLQKLATLEDLKEAPPGSFVKRSASVSDSPWQTVEAVFVGDRMVKADSSELKLHRDLGLLTHISINGQVVHRSRAPANNPKLYETRAAITPKGDYLLMFPDGLHATGRDSKTNDLLAYRSSDQGKTWQGPIVPFGFAWNHRAFLPLVPSASSRIYAFGSHTARSPNPVGFRYSDDNGFTWSDLSLVRPVNQPEFGATGVIEMTQTDSGACLIGFHGIRMLRGEKRGEEWDWMAVPLNRPADGYATQVAWQMDELRVIKGRGQKVLAFARTREGHLWRLQSDDDGKNWSKPRPTTLVQPDAPPMVFHLSDGNTLIALHHNRFVPRTIFEAEHKWRSYPSYVAWEAKQKHSVKTWSLHDWVSRGEVWFSTSTDEGETWSEPRFLFANALDETEENTNGSYQCSYVDLLVDDGNIHMFVPHRWRQVIHLHMKESDLANCPTRAELSSQGDYQP